MSALRIIIPGRLLTRLRVSRGYLTQQSLADAAEIEIRTVRRIETTSDYRPRPDVFQAIAKALGLDHVRFVELIERELSLGGSIADEVAVVGKPTRGSAELLVHRLLDESNPLVSASGLIREQVRGLVIGLSENGRAGGSIRDAVREARRFGQSTGLLRLIDGEIERARGRVLDLHLQRATLCLLAGDVSGASRSVEAAVELGRDEPSTLLMLAQLARIAGNWSEAERACGEALAKSQDVRVRISGLGLLSDVQLARGDMEGSATHAVSAIELAESMGEHVLAAEQHRHIAIIRRRQVQVQGKDNPSKMDLAYARWHLARAIRLSRLAGDRVGWVTALDNTGVVYLVAREFRHAKRLHRKALEMNRRLRRRVGVAAAQGNLAILAAEEKRYDDAVRGFRAALRIFRDMGWKENEARAEGNIAQCYTLAGRKPLAIRHWIAARECFTTLEMARQRDICEKEVEKLRGKTVQTPFTA